MKEFLCANCGDEVSHTEIGKGLFKCVECGTVRTVALTAAKPLKVKLIISELDRSRIGYIELRKNEPVKTGDEFAVEDGDEVCTVKITAIEAKNGKRAKAAKGEEIACLWGKIVSEINLKFAVQEKGETRSFAIKVPGDREFSVGGEEKIGGEALEITAIKIREGRMKRREGDTVLAKDIKRVFSKLIGERLVSDRTAREKPARVVIRKRRI